MLKRPSNIPQLDGGTNAFVCSIEVANFDEIAERILTNGGQIALPKFAIPARCFQGYFVDLDKNTFGIFEVNAQAK